jgi:thiamine-phosphate pyrophosphorylase
VTALPAPLLVITDRHQAQQPLEALAKAIGQAGGRWLLLRDKDLDPAPRRALAVRLAGIAVEAGMHLSVSRDIDLAAELGCSVHLQSAATVESARRRLGAGAIIGVSAHREAEVAAAAAAGADYATLSPIFVTASKPGYGPALGIAAIAPAARLGIAVVALGGIGPDTIGPCFAAGATGVAVMGEVMRSAGPARTVGALVTACKVAASG